MSKSRILVLSLLQTSIFAATLSLPPCNINPSFGAPANACETISGFGSTVITAGVAATGGNGSATGVIDVFGATTGPVRAGLIQISLLSGIQTIGFGNASLDMSVGDYSCTLSPEFNFCYIGGSSTETTYLPFTLGEPFEIQLEASTSTPNNPSSGAFVAGAISFSVYEEQPEPAAQTSGQFHSLALSQPELPGESVDILEAATVPEPGTLLPLLAALLVCAAYKSWPARRTSSSRISISRNSVR